MINPSLSVLVVIDVETDSILYLEYGVGFTWIDETPNSLPYIKPVPYFVSINGFEKYIMQMMIKRLDIMN